MKQNKNPQYYIGGVILLLVGVCIGWFLFDFFDQEPLYVSISVHQPEEPLPSCAGFGFAKSEANETYAYGLAGEGGDLQPVRYTVETDTWEILNCSVADELRDWKGKW